MEPIATYSERLLEVRRRFALYDDRVEIDAAWLLRGRFRTSVELAKLKREPRRFFVRYRVFRWAGWALAVGLLVFAYAFYRAQGGPLGPVAVVGGAVAGAGLAVMLLAYPNRQIRFARFDAVSGRGGLDIGQAGSSPAAFDEFVQAVGRQIARSQARR